MYPTVGPRSVAREIDAIHNMQLCAVFDERCHCILRLEIVCLKIDWLAEQVIQPSDQGLWDQWQKASLYVTRIADLSHWDALKTVWLHTDAFPGRKAAVSPAHAVSDLHTQSRMIPSQCLVEEAAGQQLSQGQQRNHLAVSR